VDADKDPLRLLRLQVAVFQFRRKLEELLTYYEPTQRPQRSKSPVTMADFEPLPNVDRVRQGQLRDEVTQVAAKASDATALTGVSITSPKFRGPLDPFDAWPLIFRPEPPVKLSDIFDACSRMLEKLDGMIRVADADSPPTIRPKAIHPLIWDSAADLWRDNHRRQAVATAAEALITHVKTLMGRNDIPETSLWQETFRCSRRRPASPASGGPAVRPTAKSRT